MRVRAIPRLVLIDGTLGGLGCRGEVVLWGSSGQGREILTEEEPTYYLACDAYTCDRDVLLALECAVNAVN